jgi:hypothetical protein
MLDTIGAIRHWAGLDSDWAGLDSDWAGRGSASQNSCGAGGARSERQEGLGLGPMEPIVNMSDFLY